MSSTPNIPATKVVDTVATLLSFLDSIASLPTDPPSLFIDLEGVNLGRNGSLSIVSVYVPPRNTVYLVDVHRLGEAAFSTTNGRTTFKAILESAAVPKVVFDIRNDSDALFSLFNIRVKGIRDLQLMELGSRRGSKTYVAGLTKCIERDADVPAARKAEWKRRKDRVGKVCGPERGGSREMFNERPFRPEIVKYCAQDVSLLPVLFRVYDAKLRQPGQKFWRFEIDRATKHRIKVSQSPGYDGKSPSEVNGPWSELYIREAIAQWNWKICTDRYLRMIEKDLKGLYW